MRFSRKWYRTGRKAVQGVFGGTILSQTQIKKLNDRITSHEAEEFKDFEKHFDQQLNNL